MGVLADVFSVGPNGHLVGALLKRWLEDVITVGPNGYSVDESLMRLLGEVITEGSDGPSLGPSSVLNIYIDYVYIIYLYICGNVGMILIRLISR
jgi:hypothetical protein